MCRIIEEKFSGGTDRSINVSSHMLFGNDVETVGILITHSSDKQWNFLRLAGCHIRDAGIKILHHFYNHPNPLSVLESSGCTIMTFLVSRTAILWIL